MGEPQLMDVKSVSILSEKLHISHKDGYNVFDVEYVLKNISDSLISDIDYGFPVDYYVGADSLETHSFIMDELEGYFEIGWVPEYLKDVSFKLNGRTLPFQSARESVENYSYQVFPEDGNTEGFLRAGINRRWFYTRFSIEPGAACSLTVTYKVYAQAELNPYGELISVDPDASGNSDDESLMKFEDWRNRPDYFRINYDFAPAAHWGAGRIGSIEIEIDLTGVENCYVPLGGYMAKQPKLYFYKCDIPVKLLKPIDLKVYRDSIPYKSYY
ncbi:MAG: hypothetical protein K2M19_08275 [Muribaculaceae bacterium]|nr:hypothetical protein [Muribaculaceae bacterium]